MDEQMVVVVAFTIAMLGFAPHPNLRHSSSGVTNPVRLYRFDRRYRWAFAEVLPFPVFGAFAGIEGGYRAVVTHDAGPDLAARALAILQPDIGLPPWGTRPVRPFRRPFVWLYLVAGYRPPTLSCLATAVFFVVQINDFGIDHCFISPVPIFHIQESGMPGRVERSGAHRSRRRSQSINYPRITTRDERLADNHMAPMPRRRLLRGRCGACPRFSSSFPPTAGQAPLCPVLRAKCQHGMESTTGAGIQLR